MNQTIPCRMPALNASIDPDEQKNLIRLIKIILALKGLAAKRNNIMKSDLSRTFLNSYIRHAGIDNIPECVTKSNVDSVVNILIQTVKDHNPEYSNIIDFNIPEDFKVQKSINNAPESHDTGHPAIKSKVSESVSLKYYSTGAHKKTYVPLCISELLTAPQVAALSPHTILMLVNIISELSREYALNPKANGIMFTFSNNNPLNYSKKHFYGFLKELEKRGFILVSKMNGANRVYPSDQWKSMALGKDDQIKLERKREATCNEINEMNTRKQAYMDAKRPANSEYGVIDLTDYFN